MNQPGRGAIAAVLLVFAGVFIALTVGSYTEESATWDEPQHLTSGYVALTLHDHRVDPEHPPLVRVWVALPLLLQCSVRLDASAIGSIPPPVWVSLGQFEFCHWFLYQQNDADRLLYAGRFMIVLLGILLGILLFAWARELWGFWPAVMALAFFTIEPNLLAHSSLVTTDLGSACFIFGALYFLWRTACKLDAFNLAGLALFFVLAQLSKFTALLLGPIVLVLLVTQALRAAPWPCQFGTAGALVGRWRKTCLAAAMVLGLALLSWLAIWAAYDFRYLPSAASAAPWKFETDPGIQQRTPTLARAVGWANAHRLLPNAYTEGFLLGQAKAQVRSAFLAGNYSTNGWWYYFPVALLIKTPLALLIVFGAGLALAVAGWRQRWLVNLFVLVPVAAYLGTAMAAHLNIGLRHVLVVYPFLLLLGTAVFARLFQSRNRWWRIAPWVAWGLAALELATVAPHYLAFFNRFVGGPAHGSQYLVDSNLDWGQDLKGLERWMDRNAVSHVNLAYFGSADPAYYRINYTPLPGAPFFDTNRVRAPRLPGYVAVSVTNLRGVYLDDAGRRFYAPLRDRRPVATIGHSIAIWWVDRPWW